MRIIVAIAMLISSMFTAQTLAANGVWEAPSQTNCETDSTSRGKKDCIRMNYCISSSNEGCLAHVGDVGEDQGRSGLLAGCFQRKMRDCVGSARDSSTRSTNLNNNPDAWDCITNPGKSTQGKASPSRCRRVNFCLGSAGTTCSEQIGSAKYTDKGQYEMAKCVHEKEIACMRTLQ